ncbi:zinc-binding dehydrogenase [Pseudomonas moraviensis]|jgi:NADPH:quinone reductase-like Zn-dependent oxidoreductase|uniref:quinone oxidoreductase family protein n=1 Tax=Pseudomonas TaxID=286 RepID=UPI00135D627D|nr:MULTISPECIES: zinc-binding dehydrogenase [Pseudomonas]MXI45795.1 zinc-binding dehydrogenase [Pseudomonas moraviensis]WLG62449.1 zinc-binding dehydrogenase [Pseudomonas sp. FP1762]
MFKMNDAGDVISLIFLFNGVFMKASIFREFGGPNVLRYEDVATPSARPGHVVIRVLAAGINRLELYLREGAITRDLALPHILGSDAVGEVVELGAGVTDFSLGERVVPMPGYPLDKADYAFSPMSAATSYAIAGIMSWGAYAEYMEVPAHWLLRDDTGLSPEELATLPMVLVTAVRAVRVVGAVKAGDTVLVQAGGSGTGSMSIQIAKALGARVVTTVSNDEKAEVARKLGADLVINSKREDFVAVSREWTGGKGMDVTIDNLGGEILARSIEATRPTGTVVTLGFVAGSELNLDIRSFFFSQRRLLGTLMGDLDDLRFGLDLIKKGAVRPVLDQVIPLSEAARAHELLGEGRVSGNLVLKP